MVTFMEDGCKKHINSSFLSLTVQKSGWFWTLFLSVLPIVFLFIVDVNRFSSVSVTFNSLGKLTALSGAILFSITLLLQTRFVWIEKMFGGLDKTYKAHHVFGAVSFLLLLFHPLFLACTFALTSIKSAALFLLPSTVLAINMGIFALLLMILFLILTFFINLNYEKWKFTHQFMAVAFILACIHMLLIPSDINAYIVLKIYFIIFMLLGLFAIAYRKLLWKYLGKRMRYKVQAVKILSPTVTEVSLAPIQHKINFIAGQFIFVQFNSPKIKKEFHPFTISSGSTEPIIRLSIKKLGDFTNTLPQLTKNSKVIIEGPFGVFCSSLCSNPKQVWIAGGIGITPFLSMARSLKEDNSSKISLIYSVVTKEEAIFLQELQSIEQKIRGFKVIPHYAKEQGFLTMDAVIKNTNLKSADFFICGPPPMMMGLKKQAKLLGIKTSKIHMEEFSL